MKIKYLVILLFLSNITFSQVKKIDLNLGSFGKRELNVDSNFQFKLKKNSENSFLDSIRAVGYLSKAIMNIHYKVYMSPSFNQEDFLKPQTIDFQKLKKSLFILSDNSHFGKSGNHRIVETSLKENIITLKEYQIKDLHTIKAYLEVKVDISKLDKPKITSLSITKYPNCYCDEIIDSCDRTETIFFPKSSESKINIPYGCINNRTESTDH